MMVFASCVCLFDMSSIELIFASQKSDDIQ